MDAHIDVFVNDWTNSVQRLIARVRLVSNQTIEVEMIGDEQYRAVILAPIRDPDGHPLSPQTDAVEFYKWLPAAFTNSYLGATETHNGNCPFRERHELPFDTVEPDHTADTVKPGSTELISP
jgi:hypothetical protein